MHAVLQYLADVGQRHAQETPKHRRVVNQIVDSYIASYMASCI